MCGESDVLVPFEITRKFNSSHQDGVQVCNLFEAIQHTQFLLQFVRRSLNNFVIGINTDHVHSCGK